jgi:pyrimidine-nucleoside phosphorylase
MYALRDVTGTVESIPLISGSIMSKKLAEGIDALVLDVKTGRGAFMQSEENAIELAKTLIAIGESFGKRTIGFLTDMNQPLGYAVGNWVEVVECVECMQGRDIPDLMEVTYVLGGAMVMLGGKSTTIEEGIDLCKKAIASGKALEKFRELVKRQYGDVSFIDHPEKYPTSAYSLEVKSVTGGIVQNIDSLEIGFAGITLGAGRMKIDDIIDMKAGIVLKKKIGDAVKAGETLAVLSTDKNDIVKQVEERIRNAYAISSAPATAPKLVHAMIDVKGVRRW